MTESRGRGKRLLFKCAFIAISGSVTLLLADVVMGLLGFPSEPADRVAHPAGFREVRKNIEFEYTFETNDRGLRYRTVAGKKPADTRRIFVAGDSFTEGVGIDEGKRFADLLEQRAPGAEYINGGLAGTGPLKYGKLFLDVGMTYEPDALLICLFVNDVHNTPETVTPPFFDPRPNRSGLQRVAHVVLPRLYTQLSLIKSRRALLRRTQTMDLVATSSAEAQRRGIPEEDIERWKNALPAELVDAANERRFSGPILSYGLFYPNYMIESIDLSTDSAQQKVSTMKKVLSDLVEQARANKVEVAVVLLPSAFQYDPESHRPSNPRVAAGIRFRPAWLTEETEIQKSMKTWAEATGVPLLDLTPVFREAIQSRPSLNYPLDGHWNEAGHAVAADAMAGWLKTKKVFGF